MAEGLSSMHMAFVPIPKPVKKKQKPTKQQQQKNPTTFPTENQSEQVGK